MNYWLFIIPLLTTLTGWIINSIGIALFLKRILPKKLPQLARQTGKFAGTLISFDSIEKKINDPKSIQKILPMIETHVDDFLKNKLVQEMPFLSMFIGDKTIASVKKVFMQEIQTLFPQVLSQFTGNLSEEFNVEKLVTSKLSSIPPSDLEKIMKENMAKELQLFRLWGAFGGFLAGLIAVVVVLIS